MWAAEYLGGDSLELSVIVPVGSRHSDLVKLHSEYKEGLASAGVSYECIFVLDGARREAAEQLKQLLAAGENITVLALSRSFGEATALMAGFMRSSGQVIVTLPAYHQIAGSEIVKLVNALDTADLAIGNRSPRAETRFEAFRRRVFHGLIAAVTGMRFKDLGCGARAMRRQVLEEISLYGDQHRFLPLLARRQGFRVAEVDVRQSLQDRFEGVYRPREYAHRALDVFTVFFLIRFTKKPLRFFGMLGVLTFALGFLLIIYLVIERLFFGEALADRPALLLSALLLVLGVQLFALGLLGELIIFTHARGIKDYQVEEVYQYQPGVSPAASESCPTSAARAESAALGA
jgi:glycosyltransferase involved in cell wall biosynthesis